jgi:SNF2 family DNA or RNA helicase
MNANPTAGYVVDVRISESLDALFLTPREPRSSGAVFTLLRRSLRPDLRLRRSAEGIRLPAGAAVELKEIPGLQLRWTGEAERFRDNRCLVQGCIQQQYEMLRQIKSSGVHYARSLVADSTGLKVLDSHQIINVAAMTADEGFGLCVFDEQGAGKTVTMIYAFDLLVQRDLADVLLVVAPKSMVPEWPADFTRFLGDLYRVSIVTGTARDKRDALKTRADVFVTNFETAVSLEPELRALLRASSGRAILAVDESFFIKSLDAQRTRALRRLREWCGRAFVLCGTPAPNSPGDLVQQFSLVDFGRTFEGIELPNDRAAALPAVQEAIEGRGLYVRHLKARVLPDLPQKRFQRVYVPLEPVQRRAYARALHDYVLDLESMTDEDFRSRIPNVLARRTALLQICSNPSAIVRGYRETPAKMHALDALLQELIQQKREKVVLWSFYTAAIDALVARYASYNVARYDGVVAGVEERRAVIRRFQHDEETMLLVANPAAAGAGLTLHRARFAIYESLSNQAAHYLQSLDRIHRRGQTRDVEYIILLAEGTIEVIEYERLMRKQAAAQSLLGDPEVSHFTRHILLTDARAAADLLSRGT